MFWKTMIYREKDMIFNLETFNSWIKRHKLFALSAPIVVLLMIYFLAHSIGSFGKEDPSATIENAYNNKLPNQDNELKIQKPNDLYRKSQEDSLASLRGNIQINSIVAAKKQRDSLELILEELNNFSLDESNVGEINNSISPPPTVNSIFVKKKSEAQEQLEYIQLLREARDERLSRSQDYTAPYLREDNGSKNNKDLSYYATVYQDQFILPGNRVILILEEDVYYSGNHFPKNTFIYATSNIQGSRVLLEVTNINNVQLTLIAVDQQDGMIGLHNERAGELLQEFKTEIQDQGINELSEVVGETTELPLAKNLVRTFGNFFKKKKYKERDKILLVNGDRVFLKTKKR